MAVLDFLDVFEMAYRKDPALRSGIAYLEVITYPGVQAILLYRLSHALHRIGIPFVPRAISYFGRAMTGAEIHPGAKIGKRFFIDHATGVVIGETAEIGDNVMMFHQVTLGGGGWWKDEKGSKRHPTIEDDVILGVGATILGPVTIKRGSKIGAHALIVDDIPEGTTMVSHKGKVLKRKGAQPDRRVGF